MINPNKLCKWRFTPYDLNQWNKSTNRVLFVAPEPNGEQPNSGIPDMGNWFITASPKNNYHGNQRFYNPHKIMLDGINGGDKGFSNFRFMDLKATQGGAKASYKEILEYVQTHPDEIMKYFNSTDESFGLSPHIIVLLGDHAQKVFVKLVKQKITNKEIKWIGMPHPSSYTSGDGWRYASKRITENLKPINQSGKRWSYKKDNFDDWGNI